MTAKANRLVLDSGMMEFLHTHASPLGVLVTASIATSVATSMATQITPGPNNVIMLIRENHQKRACSLSARPFHFIARRLGRSDPHTDEFYLQKFVDAVF